MNTEIQAQNMSTQAMVFDFSIVEKMNQLANMMATSKVAVPAHFRNSPGDCLAVVMQAVQWGMNPFAVAQKTFCLEGVLGYEAQLVNAVVSARAPITGRLEYEWFGNWDAVLGKFSVVKRVNDKGKEYTFRTPNWTPQDEEGCGVRVWATLRGEDKPRELTLLLTQARTRNSTLWADDPRQQLAYLAVKRWARLYCPDVILGVYTPDELDERVQEKDITAESEQIKPPPKTRTESVKAALADKRGERVPPVVVPRIDDVLAAISQADTMDALNAASKLAAGLPAQEKDRAREAFKARRHDLSVQASVIDQDTGEVIDADPAGLTFAEVADMIAKATTDDAMVVALDAIRSVSNPQHREELSEMANNKRRG